MTGREPDGIRSAASAAEADAPGAPDQTERVILAGAEEILAEAAEHPEQTADVLVLDDATGQLITAALEMGRVRAWSASRADTLALAERFAVQVEAGRLVLPVGPEPTDLETFAGASVIRMVLMRLPKALHCLDHRARSLARAARANGQDTLPLVAGGRVKHMTRQQNEVLTRSFATVRATRGIGKSRALVAADPHRRIEAPTPAQGTVRVAIRGQEEAISVRGIGGVFGAASADAGSLLLLAALDRAVAGGAVAPERTIDLGSGNGLLSAYLASAFPSAAVVGSDDDADAVASTRATLEASQLDGADVTWDHSLSREADGSADLVLLNPPFHDGPGVDPTLVQGLLDAAGRVLRPGGELWFVHNSHLRFRTEVERRIGPVRQRSRDRRFTVLSARRA